MTTAIPASRGLKITCGGRFFHLISAQQDKGRAVKLCTKVFAKNTKGKIVTLGIGDSAIDIAMLKAVDIPILLPHFDGSYEDIDRLNLIKANHPGSRGWNEAIIDALNKVDSLKRPKRPLSSFNRIKKNRGISDGEI